MSTLAKVTPISHHFILLSGIFLLSSSLLVRTTIRSLSVKVELPLIQLVFESIDHSNQNKQHFASFLSGAPFDHLYTYSKVIETELNALALIPHAVDETLHGTLFNFEKLCKNPLLLEYFQTRNIPYSIPVGNQRLVFAVENHHPGKIIEILHLFVATRLPASIEEDQWFPFILSRLDCFMSSEISQAFWYWLSWRDLHAIFKSIRLNDTCNLPSKLFSRREDPYETTLLTMKAFIALLRCNEYGWCMMIKEKLDEMQLEDGSKLSVYYRKSLIATGLKQKSYVREVMKQFKKLLKEADTMTWRLKVIHVLLECLCLYAERNIDISKYWTKLYKRQGNLMMPMDVKRLVKILSATKAKGRLTMVTIEMLPLRMKPLDLRLQLWRSGIVKLGLQRKIKWAAGVNTFNKLTGYLLGNFLERQFVNPATYFSPPVKYDDMAIHRLHEAIRIIIDNSYPLEVHSTLPREDYEQSLPIWKVKGRLCINPISKIDFLPLIIHSLKILVYEGFKFNLSILPGPDVDIMSIKALHKALKPRLCKTSQKRDDLGTKILFSMWVAFRTESRLFKIFSWSEIYELIHDPSMPHADFLI